MLTIEEGISRFESFANLCEKNGMHEWQKEHEQYAAWLRELQEHRKADSCEGCVNEPGKENLLVCCTCRRHYHYVDLYKPERRSDG